MKVKISKRALAELATRAEKVADGKSLAAFGMVVLRAEGAKLFAIATDAYSSVRTAAPCEVEHEGVVAVEAKELKALVTKLADGDVRLSVDDRHVEVRAGRSRYRLATGAADDVPPVPYPEGSCETLDAGDLTALFDAVAGAMSTDSTRPHLACVNLEVEATFVRAVTTDGHRLHRREVPRRGTSLGTMLVPPKGVALLRGLEKGPVELAIVGKSNLFATQGDTTYGVKLTGESFPPYERVIPKPSKECFGIAASDAVGAIRRLETLLKAKAAGVLLKVTPGMLTLSAEDGEKGGTGVEELPCDAQAETKPVGLNAAYFAEAIRCASNDLVVLHVGGPLDPVVVRSEGYTAVVMPMRVGGEG